MLNLLKTEITIKNRVNSYMQNYNIFSLKGKGILILPIEQEIKVFVSKPWTKTYCLMMAWSC